MRTLDRAGRYWRVGESGWHDPFDGSYSMVHGGRWNAPGAHPVCYLNGDLGTAAANAKRMLDTVLAGLLVTIDDLEPEELPVAFSCRVPPCTVVDVVTDDGCLEVALPTTYPLDHNGDTVPWPVCQTIGADAYAAGLDGIASRTTTGGGGEELAWFDRPGARLVSDGSAPMPYEDYCSP